MFTHWYYIYFHQFYLCSNLDPAKFKNRIEPETWGQINTENTNIDGHPWTEEGLKLQGGQVSAQTSVESQWGNLLPRPPSWWVGSSVLPSRRPSKPPSVIAPRGQWLLLCSHSMFPQPYFWTFSWPLCSFPGYYDEVSQTHRIFSIVQWTALLAPRYLDSRINSTVALTSSLHICPHSGGAFFFWLGTLVGAICLLSHPGPYTFLPRGPAQVSALAGAPEAIY